MTSNLIDDISFKNTSDMSKTHKSIKTHHDLSVLGKALTRRSHANCELCHVKGKPLHGYEVPPIPDKIDINDTLFICETCLNQIKHPDQLDPEHWYFLHQKVWSTMPALQVTAVRVLKKLSVKTSWATELLEKLYLSPNITDWVDHKDC